MFIKKHNRTQVHTKNRSNVHSHEHVSFAGGFTVFEVVLTIAAVTILAGVISIVASPNKSLSKTMNSERRADTTAIADAVISYSVDENGALPAVLSEVPTEICRPGAVSCDGYIDLDALISAGKYMIAIPNDPTASTATGTGYMISKNTAGQIVVSAPAATEGAIIETKRPE